MDVAVDLVLGTKNLVWGGGSREKRKDRIDDPEYRPTFCSEKRAEKWHGRWMGFGAKSERFQHVSVRIGIVHLRGRLWQCQGESENYWLPFSRQARAGLASGGTGHGEGPQQHHAPLTGRRGGPGINCKKGQGTSFPIDFLIYLHACLQDKAGYSSGSLGYGLRLPDSVCSSYIYILLFAVISVFTWTVCLATAFLPAPLGTSFWYAMG